MAHIHSFISTPSDRLTKLRCQVGRELKGWLHIFRVELMPVFIVFIFAVLARYAVIMGKDTRTASKLHKASALLFLTLLAQAIFPASEIIYGGMPADFTVNDYKALLVRYMADWIQFVNQRAFGLFVLSSFQFFPHESNKVKIAIVFLKRPFIAWLIFQLARARRHGRMRNHVLRSKELKHIIPSDFNLHIAKVSNRVAYAVS